MQAMTGVALVERALALRAQSSDRLRLGAIKAFADGSIQGFSARLRWPGYYNGAPNGLWYTPPEILRETYRLALQRGVLVHTHTNGAQTRLDKLNADSAPKATSTSDHGRPAGTHARRRRSPAGGTGRTR